MKRKRRDFMTKKAAAFLSKDRKLRAVIENNGIQALKPRKDYFNVLVVSIVYQQLSGASASAIYGRLKKACNNRVTAEKINKLSAARMRKLGLSRQKIAYLKDLSKKFLNKEINPRKFHAQSDEEIIRELVMIRGIGRWTAEMFLMFSLCREDVFPADDLGIKKAIIRLYGLEDVSAKNLDKFSQRWKPYRTYASLYLWKSGDARPPKNW